MDLLINTFLTPSVSAELSNLLLLGGCLIAILECFFGYRIIRSVISILGFLLGAFVGYSLVLSITAVTSYALIGALIGGILVSILSYKVYLAGVFIISAYGIFSVCLSYLTLDVPLLYIVSLLLGLAAGYLAVHYMRPAIIIITAIHGGLTAATALPVFLSIPQSNVLYVGAGLAAAGVLVQFLTSKKK